MTQASKEPLDVATELTLEYYRMASPESVEDLQNTFLKLYSVAEAAKNLDIRELKEYMPEELKQIVQKY